METGWVDVLKAYATTCEDCGGETIGVEIAIGKNTEAAHNPEGIPGLMEGQPITDDDPTGFFCLGCLLLEICAAYAESNQTDKTFLRLLERASHFFDGE